jgi:hypothetical protein
MSDFPRSQRWNEGGLVADADGTCVGTSLAHGDFKRCFDVRAGAVIADAEIGLATLADGVAA